MGFIFFASCLRCVLVVHQGLPDTNNALLSNCAACPAYTCLHTHKYHLHTTTIDTVPLHNRLTLPNTRLGPLLVMPPLQASARLLQQLQQERAAEEQLLRALGTRALDAWRRGATLQRREREVTERREDSWRRVRGWLDEMRREREASYAAGGPAPEKAAPGAAAGDGRVTGDEPYDAFNGGWRWGGGSECEDGFGWCERDQGA